MAGRRWRISTRVRVSLASLLVSSVLLGAGALVFLHYLQNDVRTTALQIATDRADGVAGLIDADPNYPDFQIEPGRYYGYEVIDVATGKRVIACPLTVAPFAQFGIPGVGVDQATITIAGPAKGYGDCPALASYYVDQFQGAIAVSSADEGNYWVYAYGSYSEAGQSGVTVEEQRLWFAVPLGVLLITGVAWFSVRGALRPVATIRTDVAKFSATDLSRRVRVPKTGDEITALADTMNAMLDRIDESLVRQRRFAEDASHELRTPLASLRTQLEVLLAHPQRIDWQHACHNMAADVQEMQQLVADLLLLAKLGSQQPQRIEPVDCVALVEECVASRPAPANIQITVHTPVAMTVSGNVSQLARMLGNLLDNAIRHAVSTVTVTTNTDGHGAVFTVADDGQGIPPADRERVFQRFVRLDDDRSRDGGGSGLGLALSREIAMAHGGMLVVAPSNRGAVLVVTLPLAAN